MAVADGARPAPSGPLHNFLMWLGHYTARWDFAVTPVLFAPLVIAWFVNSQTARTGLAQISAGLSVVGLTLFTYSQRRHRNALCMECLNAAPILDPQGAVDRNRKHLLRFHANTKARQAWAPMVLPLASLGAGPWIRADVPLLGKVLIAVVVGAGIAQFTRINHSREVHRRLYPWCPICKRPPGDSPVGEPVPDPSGAGAR